MEMSKPRNSSDTEPRGRSDTQRAVRNGSEQEIRKRQVLLRNPVFAELGVDPLGDVVRKSALVRFAKKKALHENGEPGQAVHVVASGRVRVLRRGEAPHRVVTLAYRGPGELVGENCIVAGGEHADDAVAHDPVEAVRVPARLVARLLDGHPAFCRALLSVATARRLELETRLQTLLTRSVESRLAEFLVEAAEEYGIPESRGVLVGVKYTHQEIASCIGATRETVTVSLGELKRRELLLVEHRRLVLTDVDAMRALVR
jgi:CRP/FNR family cyclic AMP-dependent transcriptional regulator